MSDPSSRVRTALSIGAATAGAYAGLAATRWVYRRRLPPPTALPPALGWDTRMLETRRGRTHLYVRPGSGSPIVLLHSLNAVASSFEMTPVAEHLAETTDRPLYAVDWLGFGRSARPAGPYRPDTYAHQLYRVLTEALDAPADLVALSLGCEYAAQMALQAAPRVRRLALVSPTGFTPARGPSTIGRLGLSLAARTGVFDLLYYRLTRRASLRDFYERQVFLDTGAVPNALLDYAEATAHATGAPYAPRYFVQGRLFTEDVADRVYARLYRPTLLLTPETPGPTVQSFDLLPRLLDQNARHLTHRTLPGGLMPHWEAPAPFVEALDAFLLD